MPCEAPPAGTDATTVAIRVHNPEGAGADGGMSAREREQAITAIREVPRSLEGREVWQRFTTAPDRGSKEHRGMITETWGGRSKPFWHVKWDDGTDSDYDLDEVVHYLVDGFTSEYGSSPRCRSVESDRVIVPGGVGRAARTAAQAERPGWIASSTPPVCAGQDTSQCRRK